MAYGRGDGAVLDRIGVNTPARAHDASLFVLPRAISDHSGIASHLAQGAFPELDCIRGRFPPRLIAAVEHRASEIGIGAERVLIAAGFIDEDNYVYALSKSLGFEYETFDDRDRASCPLDDQRLLLAGAVGLLPLIISDEEVFVLAPHSVRQFLESVAFLPNAHFRLTSAARLNLFIADKGGAAVAYEATSALQSRWPQLSAGCSHRPFRFVSVALFASLLATLVAFPSVTLVAVEAILAAAFLAALGLRLLGSYLPALPQPTERIPDHELPVYSIIAALYREAKAVKGLVASLRDLDYPREARHQASHRGR